MATNPMQRKARNSFLLGVLITLVIAGVIIALLLMQLKQYKEDEAKRTANNVKITVLKEDVKSGEVISGDMFKEIEVDKTLIPSDAVTKDTISGAESDMIAKVNLSKNTVITTDMVEASDEQTTDDLRKVEYNVFTLPSQLQTDDYVDIRLSMPTGQDYIVVSKKRVEIPQINGVDSENTVWLNLNEGEILSLNSAIVDAYQTVGAQLKLTTYIEAGYQKAATPTYTPSAQVAQLIRDNPNIVTEAKNALLTRYVANSERVRGNIDSAISNSGEEGQQNLQTKVQESISNSKEQRQKYLESLGATE